MVAKMICRETVGEWVFVGQRSGDGGRVLC